MTAAAPPSPLVSGRRGGRGAELVLRGFAAAVVTVALALVDAAQQQPLPGQPLWLVAGYLGLFAVAHLAVRRFPRFADPLLLLIVALLNGLGVRSRGPAATAAQPGDTGASTTPPGTPVPGPCSPARRRPERHRRPDAGATAVFAVGCRECLSRVSDRWAATSASSTRRRIVVLISGGVRA
jgi:hypothetical protein